jgi:hypothetical protein
MIESMAATEKGKTDLTILIIVISVIGMISIAIGLFYETEVLFSIGVIWVMYALIFLQVVLWM